MDIESLRKIPLNNLTDIRTIKIDINASEEERKKQYLKQIKNPYCYKYKDYRVIVSFNDNSNAQNLVDILENYIKNK